LSSADCDAFQVAWIATGTLSGTFGAIPGLGTIPSLALGALALSSGALGGLIGIYDKGNGVVFTFYKPPLSWFMGNASPFDIKSQ
jgi:hypothetical protein